MLAISSGMPIADAPDPSRRVQKPFRFDTLRRAAGHWLRKFTSSQTSAPPSTAPVQVLRWVFHKDYDCLTCELTFARDDCFELCTIPSYPSPRDGIKRFSQLDDALQRQSELEAALINDGWTLELHESILA